MGRQSVFRLGPLKTVFQVGTTRLTVRGGGGATGGLGNGIINVRDFGAVCDGVTDDTVAIQAALDAVVPGQAVYFPVGTGSCLIDTAGGVTLSTNGVIVFGYGATIEFGSGTGGGAERG